MHEKTSTADKIRPFLKAMERSIENARSQRVVTGRPRIGPTPTPLGVIPEPAPTPIRMKARPKRSFLTP